MTTQHLSSDEIEVVFDEVKKASDADDKPLAFARLKPLPDAQSSHRPAAIALLNIVRSDLLTPEQGLVIYEAVEAAYPDDEKILIKIGEHFSNAIDINFLNAPPLTASIVPRLIGKLEQLVPAKRGGADEVAVLDALSSAARVSGLAHDRACETAYRRLIELEPDVSRHRYNFGLFLKTRGRFDEGMAENGRARELSEATVESYEWNYGICATGSFHGEAALEVWKGIGNKIEMGRFGLPEGRYQQAKVRLAERPLAERSADNDDPGLEETIWIERLSPCHGIIRSVLYEDLGVDYGDVILIDGAPITYHRYGDGKVPVFPHLATLLRRKYQFFDFAGTQSESRQLADLSVNLNCDAVIYSYTESFELICMDCWMNKKTDHSHSNTEEFNVVKGRIAAPPDISAEELLRQIDQALPKNEACRIFCPDLCDAAGANERAMFERKRFEQLAGA